MLDFLILLAVVIGLLAVVLGVAIWTGWWNLSPAVEVGAMVAIALAGLAGITLVGQWILHQKAGAPAASAVEVTVIAHQWWWEFDYPKYGFKTANELHVPEGRPVNFTFRSSNDFNPDASRIVHGFWVPELSIDQPVFPDQVSKVTFVPRVAGTYPGRCAVYCGPSHRHMRFLVFVDPDARFSQWVANQKVIPMTPQAGAAAAGAKIFANSPCTTCHAISGVSKGYIGPDLTHFASRTTFAGASFKNTPKNVARWIEDPSHLKQSARMPSMGLRGQQLQDLVAYLESLK